MKSRRQQRASDESQAGLQAGSEAAPRASDAALIELLLAESGLGVGEIASRLGVTATAVRQRLERLLTAGIVARTTPPATGARQRGRPAQAYSLTEKGRRTGGDNFRDLALVLWREIRGIREPAIRQGLIARVGAAMAGMYRDTFAGKSRAQRLDGVAELLRNRRIACSVESASPAAGGLPVLTSHACPYPELAEQDRGICAAERLMLQELLESSVELSACRLDGDSCCRFTVGSSVGPTLEATMPPAAGTCNNGP
jgi:predicted ArsR family transcriptional regulator